MTGRKLRGPPSGRWAGNERETGRGDDDQVRGAPGSAVDDPLAELTGAPAVVLATDPAARAAQLGAAGRVTYRISQRFAYSYDGPAHDLVHRLAVIPPARHGDQSRKAYWIDISDPTAVLTWERTPDGGVVAVARVARVPSRLEFAVFAVVERDGAEPPRLPASALTGRRLLNPTALTRSDARIRAVASSLCAGDPLTTARRCASWVHGRIAYTGGVTGVLTPAAEALAGGRGVCQDHAHVTLALCRAAGVPSRYVSGHLLGDGGTHAWVEVIVPDPSADGTARAVAIDPCHDRLADRRYLTVAVGRDYADVAPTSGVYSGPGRGSLTATKQVDVIGLG